MDNKKLEEIAKEALHLAQAAINGGVETQVAKKILALSGYCVHCGHKLYVGCTACKPSERKVT